MLLCTVEPDTSHCGLFHFLTNERYVAERHFHSQETLWENVSSHEKTSRDVKRFAQDHAAYDSRVERIGFSLKPELFAPVLSCNSLSMENAQENARKSSLVHNIDSLIIQWTKDHRFMHGWLFYYSEISYSIKHNWNAMVQSQLTATFASWVQVILLPQPPEALGLQAPTTWLIFVFLVEPSFQERPVGQPGLEPLTSSDPPASASQSVGITGVSHCAWSMREF
ncbi:hypothetical protein AAY473_001490 [Plecturocebus cupreus]